LQLATICGLKQRRLNAPQTIIPSELFTANRQRLRALLPPNALTVLNANDVPLTNGDGSAAMIPNSDLFYLTGIEQEETILLLCPDADDEKHREVLFLREPNPETARWEGHKLDKQEAQARTGIQRVHWLSEFPALFHRLMCQCGPVFLNANEHPRAVIRMPSRDARFVVATMCEYPLHDYRRLAPLLHRLRAVKSDTETALIRRACQVTGDGFRRVLAFTRPGVTEYEIEAEFAHEFIRQRCRFAYLPIIASGANACVLHYIENAATCRKGELLLLDVAACQSNYNADLTRTIPVSGRFTTRQRRVYDAVLRVLRQSIQGLRPGKKIKDWQKEGEQLMEKELVDLGLISVRDIRKQNPDLAALKKYFMHGLGHPLGLDVHDAALTTLPLEPGWIMTVEPGIYIAEEGLAVRLENDVQVTAGAPVDLLADVPMEAGEIESLMAKRRRR
jgi:Xaa-Pro aminopeptidase